MSGHSKWATTKHKKAQVDAKRGKLFTKLGKLITIAARDGKSGDPNFNPSLRMAMDNAKAASMPKDNIDRAISRGIGVGAGANIEEVIYEAYAPGGVALIIECLTDNKNRTLGEIKAVLGKLGGSLANAGSVSYLFKKEGLIIIDEAKNALKNEDLELAIIDSGAEDFEREDNFYVIKTSFSGLHQVQKALEEANITADSSEIIQSAINLISLPDDKKQSVVGLIDRLEELDDVSNVFSNLSL